MTSAKNKGKKAGWASQAMKLLIPMVITVGLCWLMFKEINFREMLEIIQDQCNYWWIALGLAISVAAQFFRACRWNIQLQALGVRAPLHILVYSIFGTYAINLLFPRLGEVWRTGYIAQRQDSPFSTVFGSMVADRLADTITVFLMLVWASILSWSHIYSYLMQNQAQYERMMDYLTSPWLWIAIAFCIGFAWWFLTRKGRKGSFFDKVQQFVKGLWQGFAVVAVMPGKFKWLLFTVGIWGCYFIQLYVSFFAFPFTKAVIDQYGISSAFVTFVLGSIAMGVPSNGGIGPWQWAVVFGLSFYSVSHTNAVAFANLSLGSTTLSLIVLGIFTFIAIILDKKKLKHASFQSLPSTKEEEAKNYNPKQ